MLHQKNPESSHIQQTGSNKLSLQTVNHDRKILLNSHSAAVFQLLIKPVLEQDVWDFNLNVEKQPLATIKLKQKVLQIFFNFLKWFCFNRLVCMISS